MGFSAEKQDFFVSTINTDFRPFSTKVPSAHTVADQLVQVLFETSLEGNFILVYMKLQTYVMFYILYYILTLS